MKRNESLRIALISDYFYPSKGGVETHIRKVGEELAKMGHQVIVITHKYDGFLGARKIGNLLVYYLDIPVLTMNTTFPTMFTNLTFFESIFRKHDINVVHGHQSLSNICIEGLFHASHLKIKTVFTDHSVFELAKAERVLVNNLNSFFFKNIDWGVCVSQISKYNTHLRTGIPLDRITVIPNGIIPEIFYPVSEIKEYNTKYNRDKNENSIGVNADADKFMAFNSKAGLKVVDEQNLDWKKSVYEKKRNKVIVLYMSRLTFRKGVNLLIDALPLICKNKKIEIHVVGGGPMIFDLIQAIDENDLHDQVKIMDEVNYEKVGDFLRSGDIFLNTSLTETFCLANLEAAACGLVVVSTNVGGVGEVLTDNSILFCEPTAIDISEQIKNATAILESYNPMIAYNKIIEQYTWEKVAKQTESLYYSIPENTTNFRKSILSYPGYRNFLCRLAICIEYFRSKCSNSSIAIRTFNYRG